MHLAAARNDLPLLQLLMDTYHASIKDLNKLQFTPLDVAAEREHLDALEFMLRRSSLYTRNVSIYVNIYVLVCNMSYVNYR